MEVPDMQDGQETTRQVYEYEELTVSKEAWPMYLQLEQQAADIDYLSMLTEDL